MSTTAGQKPAAPSSRPSPCSSCANVTWFDREAALGQVWEAVRALAHDHLEISHVLLFGSLAAGTPVPGSDADLLMVLRAGELPFLERPARYRPVLPGLAVDVFVHTEPEPERMRGENNWLVERALAEGIELELGR